jgi:DNA-binding NtrC family response regulator
MILIIDDDFFIGDVIQSVIGDKYPKIVINRIEDLNKINIDNIKLVITDYMIGTTSSNYVVDTFKSTNTPIILMSGYDLSHLCKVLDLSKYVDIICKPFKVTYILELIQKYYKETT